MKIRKLRPRSHDERDLLRAVAEARGCRTEQEIAAFFDPDPPIWHFFRSLPGWPAARERFRQALAAGEEILLFGDYDCDGITALVQIHDLLRTAGHRRISWFVPERKAHGYGLTERALDDALRDRQPGLVIALDCGSAAPDSVRRLETQGIDTIVVDHHAVLGDVPARAHLNPKLPSRPANGDGRVATTDRPALDLEEMSASGLAFLLSEGLADELGLTRWNRDRAVLLAALGTVADVVPLRGLNRALIKRGLRVANDAAALSGVPGLQALAAVSGGGPVDARTFAFRWGPRLNAGGRIEDASHPVRLLLSDRMEEAVPLAEHCHRTNVERRDLERVVEAAALTMAEERLVLDPPGTLLLLCGREWHAGVVGIVASRIRERFHRPAIVCGWHEDGYWQGSGRSVEAFDLGRTVAEAVEAGLLLGGGGHRMAAGMTMAGDQVEPFRSWLGERHRLSPEDLEPIHEVLAPAGALRAEDSKDLAGAWCRLFDRLEPFGAGNPRPSLILRGAELRWGPKPRLRADGSGPWAMSSGFAWGGRGYLFADWIDLDRAGVEWTAGGRYDLVLSVSSREGRDRQTGAVLRYYDWRVVDEERVG